LKAKAQLEDLAEVLDRLRSNRNLASRGSRRNGLCSWPARCPHHRLRRRRGAHTRPSTTRQDIRRARRRNRSQELVIQVVRRCSVREVEDHADVVPLIGHDRPLHCRRSARRRVKRKSFDDAFGREPDFPIRLAVAGASRDGEGEEFARSRRLICLEEEIGLARIGPKTRTVARQNALKEGLGRVANIGELRNLYGSYIS
jgi:hypothetical protein